MPSDANAVIAASLTREPRTLVRRGHIVEQVGHGRHDEAGFVGVDIAQSRASGDARPISYHLREKVTYSYEKKSRVSPGFSGIKRIIRGRIDFGLYERLRCP